MEVSRFRAATLDSWQTCALSHPAGSGKSILWFVEHLFIFVKATESLVVFQFRDRPRYRSYVRCQPSLDGLLLF
jgi:hypothetical protein